MYGKDESTSAAILKVGDKLKQAADLLSEAVDVDSEYWDALAVAQSTEEAEASGYLIGFRDALNVLAITGDLEGYLSVVRDQIAEQREEIAELEAE